jgi:hypothetical protein
VPQKASHHNGSKNQKARITFIERAPSSGGHFEQKQQIERTEDGFPISGF